MPPTRKNRETAQGLPKAVSKARVTGLEPAIYGVTGRRDNQLRYTLIARVKLHYPRIFVNKGEGVFRNFPSLHKTGNTASFVQWNSIQLHEWSAQFSPYPWMRVKKNNPRSNPRVI